ncbi:quinone oxidoreductase family protein [Streptomyces sp. NPDC059076]|uniref:quinone oxidoreductase family protein n=1 Tax=unclassified Streptomyces TaxID=2593676 RepID=UPI0036A2C04F
MRAVVVSRQGGPETLELLEVPDPIPGDGELLVQVAAVGVNYHDIYNRAGVYEYEVPFVPGRELAGTVVAVGSAVQGYAVGDPVATADVPTPGGYAEQVVVSADRVVRVPDEVSLEVAAAVLLQGLTADYLCRLSYPVQRGDVALIHSAAGGTGLLLTQMVRERGGRVIATVSNEDKVDLVRGMGADEVICRSSVEFDREVHRLTDGRGATVVYESIGRATFRQSLAALGRRGHLVLYGKSSGTVPDQDLHELGYRGSLTVHVPMLPDYVHSGEELTTAAARVFDQVRRGTLQVHIGGRFPLEKACAAHEALESQRTTGKLLLMPR